MPDAEESTHFWSDIWGKPVKHKENSEWLRNVEAELTGLGVQDNIHIEVMKLKKQVTKCQIGKAQVLMEFRGIG